MCISIRDATGKIEIRLWTADAYAGYGYDSAYYYTGYGYDPAYASYQVAQPGVDTGIDNSYVQGYEPATEEAADDERCIPRWLFTCFLLQIPSPVHSGVPFFTGLHM